MAGGQALEARLHAILGAELVARRASGSVVGAGPQKMVLVIIARHEGEPITLQDIADLGGYHRSTAGRAIEVLMRIGVVRLDDAMAPEGERPGWCSYTIDLGRLAELGCVGDPMPTA